LKTTISLSQKSEATIINLWKEGMKNHNSLLWKNSKESLPTRSHLPWSIWKTLNRLQTEIRRTASNMKKWGLKEDEKILCKKEDLLTHEISDKTIHIAAYWEGKGI
jgi:hypothetical protein